MDHVEVCEIFESIQGESSRSGMPCLFVRLARCNLRCRYCDSTHAWEPGQTMPVADILQSWKSSNCPIVEVTGGEPLIQPGFPSLARALRDTNKGKVLVETNGSADIRLIPDNVVAVVDVKTPGSGHGDSFLLSNLNHLMPHHELKFVITDKRDFEWSSSFISQHRETGVCSSIFFSPAVPSLAPRILAQWILESHLAVRLQLQLHKQLGIR